MFKRFVAATALSLSATLANCDSPIAAGVDLESSLVSDSAIKGISKRPNLSSVTPIVYYGKREIRGRRSGISRTDLLSSILVRPIVFEVPVR